MTKGWECPRCGTVHAPHVDACGCTSDTRTGGATLPNWPFMPSPTIAPSPILGGCEACRRSGICMCVRPQQQNWPFSDRGNSPGRHYTTDNTAVLNLQTRCCA